MSVKKHARSALGHKQLARLRRAKPTRAKIRELVLTTPDLVRLSVTRSAKHIAAQLFKYCPYTRVTTVVLSASTLEPSVKASCGYTGNVAAAKVVGQVLATRAKEKGVGKIAFDRSGYKYHGRVKALADAAREHGLEF